MSDIPRFDTKVAIIVRDDLAVWRKLNVTAFLATGIAAAAPDALGEPYVDAAGRVYGRMLGQPMLIFAADRAVFTAADPEDFDLVGLGLRGTRKAVDKATRGLALHR